MREYAEFYFHRPEPSCACRSLYDLVYRTHTGIVASKSFVFSTGDANEFAETDTKLVPRAFSRADADYRRRLRRRLSIYRRLTPRNALRRLRRTKSDDGTSAICFLSTPTTQEDSRFACVKAIPRREALTTAVERPFTSRDFSH